MRTYAFIDGFNLYHGIKELNELKWCNLSDLIKLYLRTGDVLTKTRFYTADPEHMKYSRPRHRNYCGALEAIGASVILGRFARPSQATDEKRKFSEKETDVNIAIDMVDFAHRDKFDKCVLVSADSDLLPAVRRVCEISDSISVLVLAPPNHSLSRHTKDTQRDFPGRITVRNMRSTDLAKCRLPNVVRDADGKAWRMPPEYTRKTS